MKSIFTAIQATLTGNMDSYLYADRVHGDGTDNMTWADGIVGVLSRTGGVTAFAVRADLFNEWFNREEQAAMNEAEVSTCAPRTVAIKGEKGNKTAEPAVVIFMDALAREVANEARTAADESRVARENRELKRQLRVAQDTLQETDLEAKVASMVTGEVRQLLEQKSKRLFTARSLRGQNKRAKDTVSVPTLMLSDLHWDETVAEDEVEYMNKYDRPIATARLNRTFDNAADLLFHHTAGVRHEELVIVLGGDMVSGDIHGELARTNEGYTPETVMDLAGKLAANIRGMAKEFPSIYIPCVSGNHGRLTHKPTAKGRMSNNFDWLVYKVVEAMLADVPNVMFDISRSADMTYKVYDWRYRLTHGDQFKGGSGVGGIFPSLMRTDMRKHKREASLRRDPYQYLIMGHFHRYSMQDNILVNGTLKGVDEYSYVSNFDVQPPCQALWLTHPGYGMTVSMPVFCDEPGVAGNTSAPPVSPSAFAADAVKSRIAAGANARDLSRKVG